MGEPLVVPEYSAVGTLKITTPVPPFPPARAGLPEPPPPPLPVFTVALAPTAL